MAGGMLAVAVEATLASDEMWKRTSNNFQGEKE
jgi:hypothetical protein